MLEENQEHYLYRKLIAISIEIQKARDEIYDACEKTHLLFEDCNPTFQKDYSIAIESYNYAKRNFQSPYYREILRVMGNFQKRVKNSKMKIESFIKSAKTSECCPDCARNIQFKCIIFENYYKQESLKDSPVIVSPSSSTFSTSSTISDFSDSLNSFNNLLQSN